MSAHFIGEEGPGRGLIFEIQEGEEKIIGRDPDESSLVLEDPTVSRQHARLFHAPEGVYLENLSRISPTLVNEEPIDGHALLKEGDRIQIGRTLLHFTEKEGALPLKPERPVNGYGALFTDIDKPSVTPSNGYDTIFEDRGGEESVAFPFTLETPYVLKVISGPNAGAEIGLEKGKSYIVGKDPQIADIVFQDLSVSRKHARVAIDPDGVIEIEDLGSKNQTLIGGMPIAGKARVTSQDLMTLGTTVFIILERDAPQETVFSPLPIFHKEPEKEAEEQQEEVAVQIEEEDWKKRPIPIKYLVTMGSTALTALIIFITLFSLFKSETIEQETPDPSHLIGKSLAKFEGVHFSFNPASGKLFLVGHLLTAVDAQEMLYRIGELDFVTSIENTVVIDELVDKTMNDLLSSNATFRGVTIQSIAPGKFAAMGYVDTNGQATALAEYLAVNFPYLDRLEIQISVGENIIAQVQALLQGNGFGQLSFQFTSGEVILAGNYSNTRGEAFDKMLQEIRIVPGIRGVKNFAVPSNPNQAAIDLTDQFRITGMAEYEGKGYSVVLNGKMYEVGSQINGMTILAIDFYTILLEKDGIRYKINYVR